MGLETSNYIDGLDPTWPTGLDPRNKGDDHLRLLKGVLKQTFPGEGGQGFDQPINATETELNHSSGLTDNIQAQLNTLTSLIASTSTDTVPIGGIIMYSGAFSAIPLNYRLCNGANGTPNMTDKFAYGTNTESELENTGGSADAVVVSHTHTSNSSGNHSHASAGNHSHASAGDHGHPSAGSHSHTAQSNGSHSHPADGGHTHSVSTDGNHRHTIAAKFELSASDSNTGMLETNVGTSYTGYAGSHTHSVTGGSHTHGSAGAHTHSTDSQGSHTHANAGAHTHAAAGTHTHPSAGSHTHSINAFGVSATGANIPPYIKLAYIQRVA